MLFSVLIDCVKSSTHPIDAEPLLEAGDAISKEVAEALSVIGVWLRW
jgi:hypothetical protein